MAAKKPLEVIIGAFIQPISFDETHFCIMGCIMYSTVDGLIKEVLELNNSRLSSTDSISFHQYQDLANDMLSEFKSVHHDKLTICDIIILDHGNFIIPGFVDCHTHAPQYVNCGLGLDLPLLDWLETYTFPSESLFREPTFARKAYHAAVKRHISFGSTTCCYYATIHLESTKVLVEVIKELGQRAYVGKVNMDRNSPDNLREESAEQSLKETEDLIKYMLADRSDHTDSGRIKPIITPRFVPTCSDELMSGLSKLSNDYNVSIQSHLSENTGELEWVKSLYPDIANYARVYDKFGLLKHNTIMGHGIYLSEDEIKLLKSRGTSIAHCPNSNFSLTSGICQAKKLVKKYGLKVGLATDVSGGYNPSMIDAMRVAIMASKALSISQNSTGSKNEEVFDHTLSTENAFYMATMGSAEALGDGQIIGSISKGKRFDAVCIDLSGFFGADYEHADTSINLRKSFERLVYLGDDRNIKKVWVNGLQIK